MLTGQRDDTAPSRESKEATWQYLQGLSTPVQLAISPDKSSNHEGSVWTYASAKKERMLLRSRPLKEFILE